jgi:hypothetical protein
MHDDLKPRRSPAEERAELESRIAKAQAEDDAWFQEALDRPPGQALLLEIEREEIDEVAERREYIDLEAEDERRESELILRAEAQIARDIPIRRARELKKTFIETEQSGREREGQPVF